jgi:hypothetical protein
MACCGGGDADADASPGGAAGGDADGDTGPISDVDRSCRDVCWLFFAVLFAAGAAAIGIMGFKRGRLETLIYGVDYSGQVCRSGNVRDAYATAVRVRVGCRAAACTLRAEP